MNDRMRKGLTALLVVIFIGSTIMMIRKTADYKSGGDAYSMAESIAGLVQQSQAQLVKQVFPSGEQAAKDLMKEDSVENNLPEKHTGQTPELVQNEYDIQDVSQEEKAIVWVPASIEDDPQMELLRQTDLEALRQVNEDVVGWITIPDTVINYPLLQGEDNEQYLKYTWDGKKSSVGSIFMEHTNNPDMSDFHTIIYGHNMKSKTMFSPIRNYWKTEYWENHPYVYIVTGEDVYRYEIYAAYEAAVTSDTYRLGFKEEGKQVFLNLGVESSVIETGVVPAVTDRILTLSTCTGSGYDTRWVVQARLVMIQKSDSDT